MKMIVAVALALVAVVAAAPVDVQVQPEPIPIVRANFEQQPDGGFQYGFETGNQIVVNQVGELKTVPDEENKPQQVVVVRGSYSYPGEDGKPISVTYYADETGFHAEGETIPKAVSRR